MRTAETCDLDAARGPVAFRCREGLGGHEAAERVHAAELLECCDPGRRERTLGGEPRGGAGRERLRARKPILREREEPPPAGAPADRDLAQPYEEREHLRHVAIGVPSARRPRMDRAVLERAEWQRPLLAE